MNGFNECRLLNAEHVVSGGFATFFCAMHYVTHCIIAANFIIKMSPIEKSRGSVKVITLIE